MRSQTGASDRLLLTMGHPQWQSVVTPALMYEYEDVAGDPETFRDCRRRTSLTSSTCFTANRTGSWSGFRGDRFRQTPAMT